MSLSARDPRSSGRVERRGRVVARIVRDGQQFTGSHVLHDHRAGLAAHVLDRLSQHPLHEPLQIHVDRGGQVVAVLGSLNRVLAERQSIALAVGLEAGHAVRAGQSLVEGALQARQRLVGADEAD